MTDKKTLDGIGYARIDWADVQAGDVLMHKRGDRLTVLEVKAPNYRTVTGSFLPPEYQYSGFSPYRKAEPLPTTPGPYLDKHGHLWELCSGDIWSYSGDRISHETAAHFAPFTRLVPMPTEEQVQKAVWDSTEETFTNDKVNRIVTAVMALLSGDEQEVES